MKNVEKIAMVPPMDFVQFYKKTQILEPNEHLAIAKSFEFLNFFSPRALLIIMLNYDFIFQKTCEFLYFTH